MSDPTFFNRFARVTTFRENVPKDPHEFTLQRTATSTEVTGLRIQFKIHRSLTKHPNQCDITLTNLNEGSRTDFETKPLLVRIEAGYVNDALRLLFVGDLRFGMSEQKHPNYETILQLGDGDCMHRWARVNKSYAPGVSIRTVLKDCAASMGFDLPKNLAKDTTLDRSFPTGRVSNGPSRTEMTKLLAPLGYRYSIQNNVLQILRDEDTNPGEAIPIGEGYGMIGTPQFGSPPRSGKPPHMTVKMLLYPELRPGSTVQLTSEVKNGLFRIETVRHQGDTHGNGEDSFCTTVEIKPRS
jgi:hypothetical protein